MKLHWVEATNRFTTLFEALVISLLQQADQRAAAQLHLRLGEIYALLYRAVRRGLARRRATPVLHLH